MKKEVVEKYNIKNESIDKYCPLSVGNGHFVFTCDVTGLQTLKEDYDVIPLLSMSEKFAYKKPSGQLPYVSYKAHNRNVYYQTDRTLNPVAYDNLRTNYFKYNMFSLAFYYQGQKIVKEDISLVQQTLDLFTATLYSSFHIFNHEVQVVTKVENSSDTLVIRIKSQLLLEGLEVRLETKTASYNQKGEEDFFTGSLSFNNQILIIKDCYREDKLKVKTSGVATLIGDYLGFSGKTSEISISLTINEHVNRIVDISKFFLKAKPYLSNNKEINRRIILSLYLIRINSCGDYPPAETGLTLNSWYNKFHLEMHLYHHLGLIYYGCYEEVLPSLDYYFSIYDMALKRAKLNGFSGCRWPKMTDPSGLDSPSNIGPLLVWQQPHLVFMLLEIKRLNPSFSLNKYDKLIRDSLACLASFFYLENDTYYLDYPLIPAQECFDPNQTRSPIFEVEYFCYIFSLADKYNYATPLMKDIVKKAVKAQIYQDAYEACLDNCATYTKYNYDHPLPILPYSFFKSERLDKEIMTNTLNKVLKVWQFDRMWGWDFPSLSMCLANLGEDARAQNILLSNYGKNTYLKNGHNMQKPEEDKLPLYLPGNGAFLIACYHLFGEVKNEENK